MSATLQIRRAVVIASIAGVLALILWLLAYAVLQNQLRDNAVASLQQQTATIERTVTNVLTRVIEASTTKGETPQQAVDRVIELLPQIDPAIIKRAVEEAAERTGQPVVVVTPAPQPPSSQPTTTTATRPTTTTTARATTTTTTRPTTTTTMRPCVLGLNVPPLARLCI